ncbi:transcriptional regulator [Nocardiopsis terrae]|uniref:Transcriptional regulator GlxA family with amidase domain n=1 Tax=Nocardiopsis terrae TaxID=372655 RepID=A0ABR9HCS8_9ACTN|nr:DJ-1/PfpI family protein [Nocardiopsis terrae]MBE1456824.1 transcriptional regulator GlxA family with amidase domain [Nocardiopsis terrae]GHC74923.1 transcriptional regulator [Nocardiopsis terrae]
MRKIVFLLLPGLHLLDLAGPAQVFSTLSGLDRPVELHHVADLPEVPTAQGIGLRAATDWPRPGPDDLVLVPGWRTDGPAPRITPEQAGALAAHHAAGGTVASVCSGAFALALAGLLDGRRCTTHHSLQDELARRYPRARVVPDVLHVSDDRVVTSAGIASGIDLALYLVTRWHGPSVAASVAREMVVYARRNGDESQASAMLRYRSHPVDVVHRVQDTVDARFTETLRLSELAASAGVSERTLTRAFTSATGLTPLRYQQRLRAERAEQLIGAGWTVESAARAAGFQDARMLRRLRTRS